MNAITSRSHELVNHILRHEWAPDLAYIVNTVKSAQKFFAGDIADLSWVEKPKGLDGFRMPFKKMVLESRFGLDGGGWAVIFAEETSETSWLVGAASRNDGVWSVSVPMNFYIKDGAFRCSEPLSKEQMESNSGALQFLMIACSAMACKNVRAIRPPLTRKPVSTKSRKGRQSLFSHKVLVVDVPGSKGEGQLAGGTHASPRLHLRRGHVRRLPSGESVWVQPCVVGDKSKGMVTKDYVLNSEGRLSV